MNVRQFIAELKRRNVFKVASIYAVTAWLLIQIAATTFPMFEFPTWTTRMVVILSLIGFPIALILAWAYELVPDSFKADSRESEEVEQKEKIKWQTPFLVIMIGILGFLIGSFGKQELNKDNLLPSEVRNEKVAVAVFHNFTNDPNLDALGNMASDWISSGLRELDVKTSSPEMMRRYKDRVGILPGNPDGEVSLLELTGAQYVVTGSYYQKGDSIQVTSRVESTETGEYIYDFPAVWGVTGHKENLIKEIQEQLKGYWALKKVDRLSQVNPPKYEAYQAFLECGTLGNPNCLEKVLKIDSTFLLARVYLLFIADMFEADSLCQSMRTYVKKHWGRCTEFEKNFFNFTASHGEGNYQSALDAINKNYQLDPKDLDMIHHSAYTYLYLNQPEKAVDRLDEVFKHYELYKDRLMGQSIDAYLYALNRLGRHKEVIKFVKEKEPSYQNTSQYIRALMIEGDFQTIRTNMEIIKEYNYLSYAHMFNAIFPGDSNNIFEPNVRANFSHFRDPSDSWNYLLWSHNHLYNWDSKAFAHYILKEWDKAEEILLNSRSTDWNNVGKGSTVPKSILTNIDLHMSIWLEGLLGSIYARQGKTKMAQVQIDKLDSFSSVYPKKINRFHRGVIPYWQARIYAILGEKDQAVDALAQSLKEGRVIDYSNFVYDWDLTNLNGFEPYERLIEPKNDYN